MSKPKLKTKAIRLRKLGYSYSYILNKIPVSKGTLSFWLSAIPYTPNREMRNKLSKALLAMIETKQKQRMIALEKASETAEKDIGLVSKRDIFMLGIGIYIGEGSKTHNCIRVVNSDPKIISFAIRWFKESCGLRNENFVIRLHLYPDNDIVSSLQFWSKETGLSSSQFYKTQIDSRNNKMVLRRGKLPFGTAHLSIRSLGNKEFGVVLARRIKAWMDRVLK